MGFHQFFVRPGTLSVWDNPDLVSSVGAGSVIGDQDDATYVSSQYDNTDDDHPRAGVWAAPLEPAVPSWIFDLPDFSLFGVARTSWDGDEGTPPIYLRLGTAADGPSTSVGLDFLIVPELHEYNAQLFDGSQLDFSTLVDGTAVVFFASQNVPFPGEIGSAENLHEFWIVVNYITPDTFKAPPCRLYPREDELGSGSGRIFPPPRSQQSSNRVGGGSYY